MVLSWLEDIQYKLGGIPIKVINTSNSEYKGKAGWTDG
jgi:hypothetical protein